MGSLNTIYDELGYRIKGEELKEGLVDVNSKRVRINE